MQTDFHHAVTYALARLAGFSPAEASIVGYSAQYVDDAVEDGTVVFDNGALYTRTASAHKMLDYRNFEMLANSRCWVPFHFLPGNGGLPADRNPEGEFIQKLITRPNSPVAQDMIRACIADRASPYALHRLGVSMHVYADTWAHQGFAGVSHVVNNATDITDDDGKPDERIGTKLKNFFINNALPLGHGCVLSNPDRPWLAWAYTNGLGERIVRNNPRDYVEASDMMVRAMQRFRAGDADANVPGVSDKDKETLLKLFLNVRADEEMHRHQAWCDMIARGAFGFADKPSYVPKGPGSWKHDALGEVDDGKAKFQASFVSSNWKMFHDALMAHRFDVVYRILPRYGILIG
jgi:hypothetical protein